MRALASPRSREATTAEAGLTASIRVSVTVSRSPRAGAVATTSGSPPQADRPPANRAVVARAANRAGDFVMGEPSLM